MTLGSKEMLYGLFLRVIARQVASHANNHGIFAFWDHGLGICGNPEGFAINTITQDVLGFSHGPLLVQERAATITFSVSRSPKRTRLLGGGPCQRQNWWNGCIPE